MRRSQLSRKRPDSSRGRVAFGRREVDDEADGATEGGAEGVGLGGGASPSASEPGAEGGGRGWEARWSTEDLRFLPFFFPDWVGVEGSGGNWGTEVLPEA